MPRPKCRVLSSMTSPQPQSQRCFPLVLVQPPERCGNERFQRDADSIGDPSAYVVGLAAPGQAEEQEVVSITWPSLGGRPFYVSCLAIRPWGGRRPIRGRYVAFDP